MTRLASTVYLAGLLAVILHSGCRSERPESSSATNWVACDSVKDCTHPDAVGCSDGYCVDSDGRRIEADSVSVPPGAGGIGGSGPNGTEAGVDDAGLDDANPCVTETSLCLMPSCEPGAVFVCACPSGLMGTQVCQPGGEFVSPCACASPDAGGLASCTDGLRNGTETGVDCGGARCAPCAVGQGCAIPADCMDGFCLGGLCLLPPTCSDAHLNGAETDVDCGGPACPPCGPGMVCVTGLDCQHRVCSGNVCLVATCTDAVHNGLETDVDCGGADCPPCNTGQLCNTPDDCVHSVCVAALCLAPTCTDGVRNGMESDVDCGGPCPSRCPPGSSCNETSDCTSPSVCSSGVCQPP